MLKSMQASPAVALLVLISLPLGASVAGADDAVSFKGKSVTILAGSEVGGGTDASARLIAPYLAKYLPGQPKVIVQNLPGAGGVKAANFLVQRAAPDGLMLINGSISMLDPLTFRTPNSQYDTKTLKYVGGLGRGGGAYLARKEAIGRLYDKTKKPLVIGSPLAVPRSVMQMALWGIGFLDWNATWVVGYHGTNEVLMALDRTEVDMTSTMTLSQVKDRLDKGELVIINQSGQLHDGKVIARASYGNAPVLSDQMRGKLTDPAAQRAFDYWVAFNNGDKWIALPPATLDNIVAAYREAFTKAVNDPEFIKLGEKLSDGLEAMSAKDIEYIATTLADTPPDAIEYTKTLMRQQGISVE